MTHCAIGAVMNTDDLISNLSGGDVRQAASRTPAILIFGTLASLAIGVGLSVMWLHPRPDFEASLSEPSHLVLLKIVFMVSIVALGLPALTLLSSPGSRLGWFAVAVTVPFVTMIALALHQLTPSLAQDVNLLAKGAWTDCLVQIPALAFPSFVILTILVRRLAPTNLRRTGAYIGLLSGAIGGVAYAVHCHDDTVVFVGLAYSTAVLLIAAVGALLGPKLLHWR